MNGSGMRWIGEYIDDVEDLFYFVYSFIVFGLVTILILGPTPGLFPISLTSYDDNKRADRLIWIVFYSYTMIRMCIVDLFLHDMR